MMRFPRQKKNESNQNYEERKRYYYAIDDRATRDYSTYKAFLTIKGFDYVEAELQKKDGNTVKIIVPTCIFKIMTKADINKLYKV